MYRRGFSVNSLRNSARSYYYRFQRVRNPRAWLVGAGCLLLAVIAGCCVVGAAVIFLVLNPNGRSAIDALLALV
jgi:hypothetical protein